VIEVAPIPAGGICPPLREVLLNHAFARAVLAGLAPGRLWLDRPASPRAAHAMLSYGMSLIWGPDLDHAIVPLVEHLRVGPYRERDEWLQIDPRWTHLDWDALLDAFPGGRDAPTGPRAQRFTRVNFKFDPPLFLERHRKSVLPAGWSLRPMTETEFDLPDVSVVPSAFWCDPAQFLSHGGGLCVVRDGQVGAIAFTSCRFGDELEIGIETRPAFRGQGLARALSIAMIERCLADGLEPIWSCRKENTSSFLLAKQLGFTVAKEVPYYHLPASQ
jgi:RimJ/RimL family protein N-acetyltransferase